MFSSRGIGAGTSLKEGVWQDRIGPTVIGTSAHQSFSPDKTLPVCPNGAAQCNPGDPDANQESESEE